MAHFIGRERAAIKAVIGHADLRLREEWGSSFDYTSVRAADRVATRIFIHISVTNPSNYRSNDAHARALEAIGRSRFPSTGVSYNRGCMIDGSLYELQPILRRGAHTVNDFRRSICSTSGCPGRGSSLTAPSWNLNVNSRAYVICQNVNDPVSSKQIDSLARAIVTDYRAGFITLSAARNPHGHRCVSSKSCPGNRMWAKMKELVTKIKYYLANGLSGKEEEEMELSDKFTLSNAAANEVGSAHGAEWTVKAALNYAGAAGFSALARKIKDGNSVVDRNEALARLLIIVRRDEARLIALQSLVESVVGNDPGNQLDAAQVKEIVETAIRDNVVSVDVSIVTDTEQEEV